jgi:4-amino-4-deoxy-L-arabinose transferase-like glycosyltransferase
VGKIICLGAFLLFRLIHWLGAEPNADEAYYWWWAKNFSLSYYDHPPLMAWLQGIVSHWLGDSRFSLRCLNLVSNAILFYVYWQILQYLKPDTDRPELQRSMLDLSLIICSSPLFCLMLSLAWHDHLMLCLCLSSAYVMVRFLDAYKYGGRADDRLLYGATILLGLALITKHNAVFVGLAFLVTILTDAQLRTLINLRRVCLCGLILCLIFSPVLLWNYEHDFPAFHYYVDRVGQSRSFGEQISEVLGFVLLSILMLSPFITWQLGKLFNHWNLPNCLGRETIFGRLAVYNFLLPTVAFTIIAGASTAYYYWNVTAYLLLFPLLVMRANFLSPKAWQAIVSFGLLFSCLFTINSTLLPIGSLFSPDSDQDGRILFGWETVTTAIEQKFPQVSIVATTDYRSASALAFRSSSINPLTVTIVSPRITQFNFVPLPSPPELLLWDDWHPVTDWLRTKLPPIAKDQMVTVPVYAGGVFLKNYYIAPFSAPHLTQNYSPSPVGEGKE